MLLLGFGSRALCGWRRDLASHNDLRSRWLRITLTAG
jgi:hypothetical protein